MLTCELLDLFQMPHESTVEHELVKSVIHETPPSAAHHSRSIDEETEADLVNGAATAHLSKKRDSNVPHLRPETPRRVTHHHDEDDSDEESPSNANIETLGPREELLDALK